MTFSHIEEVKQDSRPSKVTLGNINRVIGDIRALKKRDEKVYL
jgi:hypothetical protein